MTPIDQPQSPDQWQLELFERLIKIESKLDQYNEIRSTAYTAATLSTRNHEDISEIKVAHGATFQIANDAKAYGMNNSEDIQEIKDQLRWGQRTVAVLIAGAAINVIVQLLQ